MGERLSAALKEAKLKPVPGGSGNQREPAEKGNSHGREGGSAPRGGNREPLPFEALADFLKRAASEPPVEFLLEGLVPDRGRVLVVAEPSAGKTWLALVVAKAARVAGRPVWFIEEEGSAGKLLERFAGLGFDPDDRELFISHLRDVKIDHKPTRDALVAVVREFNKPVIIIDPLTSAWSGDENDTRSANELRGHLDDLAKANPGVLLLVLHHTSKNASNGEGQEVHAGRGSSVFGGWADAILNLKPASTPRGSGQVKLDVKVAKMRDGERGLRMTAMITLGTGDVSFDEWQEQTEDQRIDKVLSAMKDAPDGLSKNGIIKAARMKRETALKTVDEMERSGLIVGEGAGMKRRYKLAEPSTDDTAPDSEG